MSEAILKRVNDTPIEPVEMDMFLRAMEADEGEPCFERSVIIASDVFGKNVDKSFSVNMRMTALSKIIENESLPGWVKPKQPDGSYRVVANLYMAAGLEPMIENGKDWGFDLDALLQRAFQLGKIDV